MSKLPAAVLTAILAVSFSQLAAAQAANATSPNNPAATSDVEKDQSRDKDRTVRRANRSRSSSAGETADPNRRSPNNPAATSDERKDDSQHGFVNDDSTAGSTSSPNNPAATPDMKRRQEQR